LRYADAQELADFSKVPLRKAFTFLGYKRMQAAWLALAHEQDWLDGKIGAVQMHTMPRMAACASGGSENVSRRAIEK
jgi:hypothetical protein